MTSSKDHRNDKLNYIDKEVNDIAYTHTTDKSLSKKDYEHAVRSLDVNTELDKDAIHYAK